MSRKERHHMRATCACGHRLGQGRQARRGPVVGGEEREGERWGVAVEWKACHVHAKGAAHWEGEGRRAHERERALV